MKATFGTSGSICGELGSDAFSSYARASSSGSVASDVTFETSTSAMFCGPSLYASVVRGNSSRGQADSSCGEHVSSTRDTAMSHDPLSPNLAPA
jgi:hypothetical protein